MMKTARFIFVFALLFLVFCLFTAPASAQTNPNMAPNTNPDVPKNLHTWSQNVMIEVMSAMTCQLAGIDPLNPKGKCLGIDQETGKIGYVENGGGAIGVMGNMITMLYAPPVSASDYLQNLAMNSGIVKDAHAQTTGTGFDSLSPLLNLWAAFRNIVYFIFVLVFIVIGVAIMLRVKIDPRTVMTIQNQIPKIIIGILLVTFSFAIAGFLVDLMWVLLYLLFQLFSGIPGVSAGLISIDKLNPTELQGKSPFGTLGWSYMEAIVKPVASSIHCIMYQAFLGKTIGGSLCGGSFLGWLLSSLTFGLSDLPKHIAYFIILIILLIALFRLWFALLMAFINILINVVLAPFWIVGSLVPGSPISAVGWLKDLLANLAAFPTVLAMFLLGKVFMDAFANKPDAFLPPMIGDFGAATFGPLIGLGIILMTPNAVAMIKAAIKAPKMDTSGIGKLVGAGAAVPGRTAKSTAGIAMAYKYDITGAPRKGTGLVGLAQHLLR